MNWGKFARVGIFIAKTIFGLESAMPQPGSGATKAQIADGLVETFLQEVGGDNITYLSDPEVKSAYESARDAIVHLHNVLATKAAPPHP